MIKITTPKGSAGFLNLVRPDTRFDPEGKYKASVVLNAVEAAKLIETCKGFALDELGAKKAVKAKMPGNENEDGSVTFTFRSKSQPKVYDSKVNLVESATVEVLRVGSGSTIRINGEAEAYENGVNIGVTLHLHDVQIIHLVKHPVGGFEVDDEGSFVVEANRVLAR